MNGFATKRDISLFTFYDALFKFKVIIDDVYLFDEYISDLEKLYKKIDNFDAIVLNTLQYVEKTRSHFDAVHSFRYLIETPMYNIICYDGCYDFRKLAYDSKFMYYSIA